MIYHQRSLLSGLLTSAVPISRASRETTSTAVTATSRRLSSVRLPQEMLVRIVPSSDRPTPAYDLIEGAPVAADIEPECDKVFRSE